MKKKIDNDVLKKLEQDASTQLGSLPMNENDMKSHTSITSGTYTNIRNAIAVTIDNTINKTSILEAKQSAINSFKVGGNLIIIDVDGFSQTNEVIAFLQSNVVSTSVNTIINAVVESQAVTEVIEAKTKERLELSQTAKAGGFAELVDSLGSAIGNIFGAAILPFIIIGVIIFMLAPQIMKMMGNKENKGRSG